MYPDKKVKPEKAGGAASGFSEKSERSGKSERETQSGVKFV